MLKRFSIKNKKNSGFTIIELMIVIAIIAILAGIVFISYRGITNKAKEVSLTTDMNNTKKALAMHYAQYDRFPDTIDCDEQLDESNICIDFGDDNQIDFDREPDWDDWGDWDPDSQPEDGDETGDDENPDDIDLDPDPDPPYSECYTIYGTVRSSEVSSFKTTCVTPVAKFDGWRQISAWYDNTCGVYHDGKAYCWGNNGFGQLGNGLTSDGSAVPLAVLPGVMGNQTVKSIAVGQWFACAIASDNQAYCWGYSNTGRLGYDFYHEDQHFEPRPVAVKVESGILKGKALNNVYAGDSHACVVDSGGQAYCWGSNLKGQLGNGETAYSSLKPGAVLKGEMSAQGIRTMTLGSDNTCALDSAGQAYCWGNNDKHQSGSSSDEMSIVAPMKVLPGQMVGQTVKSISAGWNHVCATSSDSKAYCWGDNKFGFLGNGEMGDDKGKNQPFMVSSEVGGFKDKTIKSVFAGANHTCAIDSKGKTYCWGNNFHKQLGLTDSYSLQETKPVAVSTLGDSSLKGKSVTSMALGHSHSCAITSEGKAHCWGDNGFGQVGNSLSDEIIIGANEVKSPR